MCPRQSVILAVFAGCLFTTALMSIETLAEGEETSATGKVLYKGRPIPKGKIGFHSKTRGLVTAELADGVFSLPKIGAGYFKVTFEFVGCPEQYRAPVTTPIEVRIVQEAKKNVFNLELVD